MEKNFSLKTLEDFEGSDASKHVETSEGFDASKTVVVLEPLAVAGGRSDVGVMSMVTNAVFVEKDWIFWISRRM